MPLSSLQITRFLFSNFKNVHFSLEKDDSLKKLISYVTVDPSINDSEKRRIKFLLNCFANHNRYRNIYSLSPSYTAVILDFILSLIVTSSDIQKSLVICSLSIYPTSLARFWETKNFSKNYSASFSMTSTSTFALLNIRILLLSFRLSRTNPLILSLESVSSSSGFAQKLSSLWWNLKQLPSSSSIFWSRRMTLFHASQTVQINQKWMNSFLNSSLFRSVKMLEWYFCHDSFFR